MKIESNWAFATYNLKFLTNIDEILVTDTFLSLHDVNICHTHEDNNYNRIVHSWALLQWFALVSMTAIIMVISTLSIL